MILTIEPDKPLSVSLKYRNAYEKQVNGAVQFKYTLENGDILYLPPIAHAEVQSLNPAAREPFTLLKSIGQGNQAVWKVERIIQNQGQKGGNVQQVVQPGGPVNVSSPSHPAHAINSPKSITNGKAAVAVMPAAAPSLSTPQSRALVKQLFASVDAWKLTVDYARTQGIELEPTSRDICALAITGGIQVFKEGVYT